MSEIQLVLVSAAALIREDGRILLAQRAPLMAMGGLWEFPGGKVEKGETPEYALVRELKEELGITVDIDTLEPLTFASHSYPPRIDPDGRKREAFHLLMPLYIVRRWHGEPTAHYHAALTWTAPDDMDQYPMPEADTPLVEALIKTLQLQ